MYCTVMYYKNQVTPGIRPSHETYYLIFWWNYGLLMKTLFSKHKVFGESVFFGKNMNFGDKMF